MKGHIHLPICLKGARWQPWGMLLPICRQFALLTSNISNLLSICLLKATKPKIAEYIIIHVENVHDQLNMMIIDIMERYPQLGSK